MNDINWGGKANADGSITYTADASASPVTPVTLNLQFYRGYTGHHLARVMVREWNNTVTDPRFFAVADGTKVRFPRGPAIQINNHKINGTLLDANGSPFVIPYVGMHVNVDD